MKRIAIIITCVLLAVSGVSCKTQKKRELPTWIQFYSYDGIREYVSSVKAETKNYYYDDSRTTYNIFQKLSYSQSKKSVQDITKTVIPRVKDDVDVELFSASYYVDYQRAFQIKYQIEGNLYVFSYSYEKGSNDKYSGQGIHGGTIGNKSLYLYEMYGDILKGSVKIGQTRIFVEIYYDDYQTVNMEHFDFVEISK